MAEWPSPAPSAYYPPPPPPAYYPPPQSYYPPPQQPPAYAPPPPVYKDPPQSSAPPSYALPAAASQPAPVQRNVATDTPVHPLQEHVRLVQKVMNILGYSAVEEDGVFGQETKNAISAFQADNGLKATGLPDGATLGAIAARLHDNVDNNNVVWTTATAIRRTTTRCKAGAMATPSSYLTMAIR